MKKRCCLTRSVNLQEVQPQPSCFLALTRTALGVAPGTGPSWFLCCTLCTWVIPACNPRGRAPCPAEDGWVCEAAFSLSPLSSLFLCVCTCSSSDGSASQAQNLPNSQVLWPDEAVCLRRKKRHSRPDPFARLSDLCHRQLPEDQTAILSSVEHDDPGHATLL